MPIDPTKIAPAQLYTVKEIAVILGVDEQTVRRYLNKGNLSGRKNRNSRRWLIKGSEIKAFIDRLGLL